jgi:3-hydroxyacyl-CoA dehydrogenase/enoyl-CoA hydratase/3-hydroxybutyryl-CoA epimerase/enoyl-CoA isomerase
MGLILGVGFPAFRGGALRYIDSVGLDSFCRLTEKYQDLGELYRPTMEMEGKAEAGDKYYK